LELTHVGCYFQTFVRKYAIVSVRPSASFTFGSHFKMDFAFVMFGLRCFGSSCGSGLKTNLLLEPVAEAEELRRVIPVIEQLAAQTPAALSIDTLKPAVARAALAAGASIVNDVGAASNDAMMWRIVAEFRAGYICMHAQGPPATMQKTPTYEDVVREVGEFFRERLEKLNAAGVATDQVVFDPGIGFGKTLEHNLQLLGGLERLETLHRPLLLGVSRKSFIEKFSGAKLNERLPASLACATLALADGVQIIRTHDVAATVHAIRIAEAVLSRKKNA